MVTDKQAYDELMEYLYSSREVFVQRDEEMVPGLTLEALVEQEISSQIITLCNQHDDLEVNHRSIIVREVDGIVYDMQQVLYDHWQQSVTQGHVDFVVEFTGLIKNIFDGAIADLLD